ncbi:MAG: hypothetical protein LBC68_05050 [Prevotellaceae bacterium]|jgi:hypothetical protein|nr:hypothetical protein [Prevotellaceae bacterium]
MTEIAEIYKKIDELRTVKTLDEIEPFLIASGHAEDLVKHAIKYVRNKERDDEFFMREIASEYVPSIAKLKIKVCSVLGTIFAVETIFSLVIVIIGFINPNIIDKSHWLSIFDQSGNPNVYLAFATVSSIFTTAILLKLAHHLAAKKEKIEERIEKIEKRYNPLKTNKINAKN